MNLQRYLLSSLLFLGACAQVPPEQKPEAVKEEVPAEARKMESQPLKYLKGRTILPQPTRPLNVRSRCTHRDAVGTRTSLNLLVKNAEVKTFDARVDIPRHGACRFNLAKFKQVATLPNVLLETRDGSGCSVRMWEQGPRVTIAFSNCPASCEGQAFDYLWPIMVEAKSGHCF
ncbi:MAG: hypothetical protein WBH99_10350 [Azovibrio sp.]|uniref:hypothetical protein n=1 Tax=Azovibrio sp. TaxID=1872673 RepID=UPI003C72EB01